MSPIGTTRRRFLTVAGTGIVGSTAFIATQTPTARAEVTMGGLTVAESEHVVGEVTAATITIPLTYQYESPSGFEAVRLEASIGDSLSTLEPVESTDIPVSDTSGEGSYTFEAVDLTQEWHYSLESFQPADSTKQVLVAAGVRMALIDGGEVLTETFDDGAATIYVHPDGSVSAAFEGTAEVSVSG